MQPPDDRGAWWGGKPFCSQGCKDLFWERYKREHPTVCRVCKIKVELPGVLQHQGNMTFIVVGNTWDGYCRDCRAKIKAGYIDPPPPPKKPVSDISKTSKRPRMAARIETPNPEMEKPIEYINRPKINWKKWLIAIFGVATVFLVKRFVF